MWVYNSLYSSFQILHLLHPLQALLIALNLIFLNLPRQRLRQNLFIISLPQILLDCILTQVLVVGSILEILVLLNQLHINVVQESVVISHDLHLLVDVVAFLLE